MGRVRFPLHKSMRVSNLFPPKNINKYKTKTKYKTQIRGHHIANLDPLGINSTVLEEPIKFIHANYDFGK